MNISIEEVSYSQKQIIRNLMELYQYDFSEFTNDDVNEFGLYDYEYLDNYWTEKDRFPFFIKVDSKIAGFILIRKTGENENGQNRYWMSEFFVLKKYRRLGVGKIASFKIFDNFKGDWYIGETNKNTTAQKFWVKTIKEYTNNNFQELNLPEWYGPIQKFTS